MNMYCILFYICKNLDNLKDIYGAATKKTQRSQHNTYEGNGSIPDNVYQIDGINSIIKIYLPP